MRVNLATLVAFSNWKGAEVAQSRLFVHKIREALRLRFEAGLSERQFAVPLSAARLTAHCHRPAIPIICLGLCDTQTVAANWSGVASARNVLLMMKDWLFPIFAAVLVCVGLLFALIRSLDGAARTSSTETAIPRSPRPARPPDSGTSPSPRSTSASDFEHHEARSDVALLRARCIEESRGGKGVTPELHSACQEFSAASRQELRATMPLLPPLQPLRQDALPRRGKIRSSMAA